MPRKQYVHVNGYLSDVKNLTSGVPQGSILGLFLFNIYINDLVNINNQAKFCIYADDTSVFVSARTGDEIADIANNVLAELESWANENLLKINTAKTKAICFKPKNKFVEIPANIIMYSSPIEVVRSFKTLGVYFSEHMSWDAHVDHITSKLSHVVGLMYRHSYILPFSVKLLLYQSLFCSHLNYCHLIWGTTTGLNLQKIHLLQKKALRIICNVDYDFHTEPLFRNLNVMKIFTLYNFKLCMKYKIECSKNRDCFISLASLKEKSSIYPTRSSEPWFIENSRSNYGLQRIKITLPKLLNMLTLKHIDITTLSPKELRSYFLCCE